MPISPEITKLLLSLSFMVKLDNLKPSLLTESASFSKVKAALNIATLKAALLKFRFPSYLGSAEVPFNVNFPEKLPLESFK